MLDGTLRLHAAALTLIERLFVVTRPPGTSILSMLGLATRQHAKVFRAMARRQTGYAQSPRYDTPAEVLHVVLGALAQALRNAPGWDSRDIHAPPQWRQAFELAEAFESDLEHDDQPIDRDPAIVPRLVDPPHVALAHAG